MTQIAKWKSASNSQYETGDVVECREEGKGYSQHEIDIFDIEAGLTLSDSDKQKLMIVDERPDNYSAIAQIPTFRSLLTKQENMKQLHRRKYQNSGNTVFLKPNAQVKD